jgi:hypothetical protein
MNERKKVMWSMALMTLLAASAALSLSLVGPERPGGVEAFQDQCTALNLYEGVVLEARPAEYLPFKVEVNVDNAPATVLCRASSRAAELYKAGCLGEGASVLVAVDLDSLTGTVVDLVYVDLLEEPSGGASDGQVPDEPQGDEGQTCGEEPGSVEDPEEPPSPAVELPAGVELVPGVEPGPTPWLTAPEGKVKLTVMCQPSGVEGITVYPPPGVYFVEKDRRVLFSCVSVNPGWEFREWCIGKGESGSTRKAGVGEDNLTRVLINADTVVTAFHSEIL